MCVCVFLDNRERYNEYTNESADSRESLKMGKSLCDRIIFELFQRAQAASKRLQTKPGN